MAEVVVKLSGQTWADRDPWTRSIDISGPDAAKVAEWLKKMLPDLVAQAKAGYFTGLEVSVKD